MADGWADIEAARGPGREFSGAEVAEVVALARNGGERSRTALARRICERFEWRRPNGKLKLRECWEFLLQLEKRGWIELPPMRWGGRRRGQRTQVERTLFGAPGVAVECALGELLPLVLEAVGGAAHVLWSELVDRYHYLGFATPFGAQLRYLVRSRTGQELACVQFSAAAWRLAARDRWIGWSEQARLVHLPRVVQQSRFLILPWVRVPHLASHILARSVRALGRDWPKLYGHRPLVVETMVDARFAGTCYRAANWIHAGQSTGRGRMDREHRRHGYAVKQVFVLELCAQAREHLCVVEQA